MVVGWAVLLAVLLPLLLAGPARSWRRAAVVALVGLDAVGMFALPLASASRGVTLDRAPLDFLRAHLGLQRFYSMTALPPNYGAMFGLATINDDMLPVPRLWADHIRAALDPQAVPVTFSGGNAGRPPGSDARAMLFRHLDAYRALGVRYVVTPRGADSLDGALASGRFDVQGAAWGLAPGGTLSGRLPAGFAQGHAIDGMSVAVGTYLGRADGRLSATLCTASACAHGSTPLRGAADNAGLDMALSPPLPIGPNDMPRFTLHHVGGRQAVAIWLLPGSVARIEPMAKPTPGAAAVAGPGLVLSYPTGPPGIHRVFRDAQVDIFELPDPAPYFSAGPSCALAGAGRLDVTATCNGPATLLRRELAFPGWRASLDGRPAKVGREGIFQTVALPAGRSVVRFRYAPPFIGAAYAAAGAGVLWVLLAWVGVPVVTCGRAVAACRHPLVTRADALCRRVDLRFGAIGLILCVVLCFWTSERRIEHALPSLVSADVSMASSTDGTMRLFVDDGHGFSQVASLAVARSSAPRAYRLLFRGTTISRLRLDLPAPPALWPPATLTICCKLGSAIPTVVGAGVVSRASAVFVPETPLRFRGSGRFSVFWLVSLGIRCLTGLLFVALAWRLLGDVLAARPQIARPRAAILAAATLAALASMYPVVFANRSLVSPGNGGTWLAYPGPPFVPGGPSSLRITDVRGADTGATAWQYRSYSVIQAASLSHGEMPLYNRYASAGVSLIGQGTSQLGDPLQWLTIAADGAGWAWDAKFFLAKLLFCAGTGLLVLLATGSLGAALVMSGSVAFMGVFAFRLNHPAYFALCYSPWLWIGFVLLTREGRARRRGIGFLIILAATWMEMNSGAVKEGYVAVLLAFLAGGVMGVHEAFRSARPFRPLLAVLVAGILIPLMTAPWSLSFLENLARSVNYTPNPPVGQLPNALAPLLMDNAFFTAVSKGLLGVPSANPLIVVMALAGLLSIAELLDSAILVAAAVQAILCLAVAFAFVPSHVIKAIPLIGDIGHVADVFLLSSLLPLALLAGNGIAVLTSAGRRWRRAAIIVVALAVVGWMIARYVGVVAGSAGFRASDFHPVILGGTAFGTALCVAVFLVGDARRRTRVGAIALLAGLLGAHVAYGLHARHVARIAGTALAVPEHRVDFQVRSPGIQLARSLGRDPYRIAGIDGFLFPGYNASLLIEGINGPEALLVPDYQALLRALGFEDSFNWGWLHLVHPADLPRLARALDALNVRALVAGPDADPASLGGTFVGSSDLTVVERRSAWPRAFLTDRVARGGNAEAFARALGAGTAGHSP